MNDKGVDRYIAKASPKVAGRLNQLSDLVREVAPGAREGMSRGMPTWSSGRRKVRVGRKGKDVRLRTGRSTLKRFADELSGYRTTKNSVRFRREEPLPLDLIRRLVEDRLGRRRGRR